MPNWTSNTVSFTGPADQVAALKQLLAGDGDDDAKHFDFNRICPMPPVLARVISPVRLGDNGRPMLNAPGPGEITGTVVEATPEEAQQVALPNGTYTSWYDWAIANWGTKWNACHVDEPEEYARNDRQPVLVQLTYRFDTAWDAPRALIEHLEEKLDEIAPDVEVDWTAVHEDSDGSPDTIFVKGV
jgi:hypothetical protein